MTGSPLRAHVALVLDAIRHGWRSVEEIAQLTGLDASDVAGALGEIRPRSVYTRTNGYVYNVRPDVLTAAAPTVHTLSTGPRRGPTNPGGTNA